LDLGRALVEAVKSTTAPADDHFVDVRLYG